MKPIRPRKEYARMAQWLLIAIAFYSVAILLANAGVLDRVQVVLWKLGHQTIASFLGYWIDRSAFRDRIETGSHSLRHLRRAMIMAACMISVALGM